MKTITPSFLVAALLIGTTVELKTNRITPVQPGTSRPLHTSYVLKPIPSGAVHHQQTGMPRIRLWESTSGNWSGYAVPKEGKHVSDTFSEVEGTWVIPTVTAASSTTYSSVWVGLDGYTDGTVEQIGTEQDWTGGQQQNYVWFEMYPSGAYEIVGFPANPGDSISAQVVYLGQTTVPASKGKGKGVAQSVFQLTIINNSIINNSQPVSYTVPTSYTTISSAARSSAEWVVEAPSLGRILPLADFGTVNFLGCYATSTGSRGTFKPINFWSYDPLTMVDPSGGGSVPSSLSPDGTAFSVTYQQP